MNDFQFDRTIKIPDHSDWQCELWPDTYYRPAKGGEPCWFHRHMHRLILGFRWTNTNPRKRDWLGRIKRDYPFDPGYSAHSQDILTLFDLFSTAVILVLIITIIMALVGIFE